MPTRRNFIARAVWPAVHRWIRRSFPDVTQMCVEELAAQLQTSEEPDVILLDVRSIEEYAVSHIPGARRFDDQMSEAELAGLWRADRPIVTYCSIGYRSSAAARRLYSLGYRNVRNLEGSLFRWAAEGHPIRCEEGAAQHVHPYSRLWSYLLPRHLRPPARG